MSTLWQCPQPSTNYHPIHSISQKLSYRSGHEGTSVLLPGFAISRWQHEVTRQPHLLDLTCMHPVHQMILPISFKYIHLQLGQSYNFLSDGLATLQRKQHVRYVSAIPGLTSRNTYYSYSLTTSHAKFYWYTITCLVKPFQSKCMCCSGSSLMRQCCLTGHPLAIVLASFNVGLIP